MFAAVLGKLADEEVATPSPSRPSDRFTSPHLRKVAAGVRELQERSELAERLLKDGEQVVDLDPRVILPSPIVDRFDDAYDEQALAPIVASMQERGQIVPGLVRPLAGRDGMFQIVFGRRRLAAAKQLGLNFKAIVRDLTDAQAIIFQGEENSGREDLSFIEKCAFALAQEQAGHKRETICASLSTGKSHVSEMIKIASAVPNDVMRKIGAAPGIGRGRWAELAEKLQAATKPDLVAQVVSTRAFIDAASDNRFEILLKSLSATAAQAIERVASAPASWLSSDERVQVTAKKSGKAFTLSLKNKDAEPFGMWISDNLERLHNDFQITRQQNGD